MTKNLSDVGKFASLKITYPLVLNLVILILYIVFTYKNNLILDFSLKKRIYICASISVMLTIALTTSISAKVFSAFEIETNVATNILESNEQFSDIGFLPYLAKTTSENLMDIVNPPENYSYDSINELFSSENKDSDDSKTTNSDNITSDENKPNVIFIMSESFSDFRVFDSLNILLTQLQNLSFKYIIYLIFVIY